MILPHTQVTLFGSNLCLTALIKLMLCVYTLDTIHVNGAANEMFMITEQSFVSMNLDGVQCIIQYSPLQD